MAEKHVLRALLYLVFIFSALGMVGVAASDSPFASSVPVVMAVSLAGLAVSAYDPRYNVWVEPPPKRPRED